MVDGVTGRDQNFVLPIYQKTENVLITVKM
jgi:hypothetical protein